MRDELKLNNVIFAVVYIWAIVGELGYARFLHTDADEIDEERNLGIEYYNDVMSYLVPYHWERDFNRSLAAYQINTGSLDIRTFNFTEKIMLATNTEDNIQVSYKQLRNEDSIEQRLENELALKYRLVSKIFFGVLTDANSVKKFGDIGVGVFYLSGVENDCGLQYWRTDHYYNSKEENETDRYRKIPWTTAVRCKLLRDKYEVFIHGDYDNKLSWNRESKGYQYQNERRKLDAKLALKPTDQAEFQFSYQGERKKEAVFGPDRAKKQLDRASDWGGLRGYWFDFPGQFKEWSMIGFDFVRRDGLIELVPLSEEVESLAKLFKSSPNTKRRERAIYLQRSFLIGSESTMLFGLFANYASSQAAWFEEAEEVKAQTGWSINLNQHAVFYISATWDIDQLRANFPYSEKKFKPWGGGQLAVNMHF